MGVLQVRIANRVFFANLKMWTPYYSHPIRKSKIVSKKNEFLETLSNSVFFKEKIMHPYELKKKKRILVQRSHWGKPDKVASAAAASSILRILPSNYS